MEYIKNKGVFVGLFNEEDLRTGKDKKAVEKAKKETGLHYVNTAFVKSKGKITGMKIWVCTVEDFSI